MMVPGLPWHFGPYQDQAYRLTRQLHERHGYNIIWVPTDTLIGDETAPMKRDADEVAEIPGLGRPADYGEKDAHLTYVSLGQPGTSLAQFAKARTSHLNRMAREFGIDAYIALMDVVKLLGDEDFAVPAIAWFPLHYKAVDSADRVVLRSFSAIASLAPSSALSLRRSLYPIPVAFIPHIVERHKEASAAVDEAEASPLLKKLPETEHDPFVVLIQGGNYDAKDRKGFVNALQAFARFHAAPDVAASRGGKRHKNKKKSTKLLKLDDLDAAAEPHRPSAASPPVHLYIHAPSDRAIAENDNMEMAPANFVERGVPMRTVLDALDLPPSSYTLDERILPTAAVWALKRRASVCLHPSRVEGFGMNILECQATGTPVITTAYMAMRDFTKRGVAVEPRQLSWLSKGFVAEPDVKGIANALRKVRAATLKTAATTTTTTTTAKQQQQHGKAQAQRVGGLSAEETIGWVNETFSAERVGRQFHNLLLKARAFILRRQAEAAEAAQSSDALARQVRIVRDARPPPVDWDTTWTVCAHPDVGVDEDQLGRLFRERGAIPPLVDTLVFPTHEVLPDGTTKEVPFSGSLGAANDDDDDDDGADASALAAAGRVRGDLPGENRRPSPKIPMGIRTSIFAKLQLVHPYCADMVIFLLSHRAKSFLLPPGLAVLRRRRRRRSTSSSSSSSSSSADGAGAARDSKVEL